MATYAYASFGSYYKNYPDFWEAYDQGAEWARKGNTKLPKTFQCSRGEFRPTSSQLEAIDFRRGWADFGKGRNPNAAPSCSL